MAFLLLPSMALAAGLGKLTVFSGLGQPLKAEIDLLAVEKGEADNLSVRLPSADAFRRANIEYAGALLSVKFSVEQRGANRYVVALSSTQPINEPFLDLLVELDWKTGRLVREYTFLLDPPEYKGPQSAPVIAAPAAGMPAIKSVEIPKSPAPEARGPVAVQPLAAPTAAAPKASKSYQVKPGDTLTKIATANKSDNVSLQQMLIALYRSNADAFDGSNINRMRAGKILNIPDMGTVAAVDQDEAVRTVSAQAADFDAYRRNLAGAVASAPTRAEQHRQSASGKITAKIEEQPEAAKKTEDRLKLSKAEVPGKTGALSSRQGLQEDLIAKEAALKEANERIAMLEKNVHDMQKLLELKSQSGAQLQEQAAKAGAAKVAEPAKAPEPAKSEGAASKAAPPSAAPPKAAPPKAVAVAPTAPHKAVAPPPAPEPSLVDEILGNELALYGGGGFLALLFAGYGYYAWRRKKTLQIMESSVMGAPGLAADSVFGAAGGAKVDTGAGGAPGDLGPGGTAAAIDTEEVDPIAEADVYMAYGRDAQAEEILKEALAKDPSRQKIRVKLLEIYANRKDARAFESVAAEIHAATNGEGADWEKAVALGAQLDPENPLYSGKAGAGGAHEYTDTLRISPAEPVPDLVVEAGGAPEPSPGLDIDLGLGGPEPEVVPQPEPAPAAAAEEATEIASNLDFDLDLGGGEKTTKVAPAPVDAASSIDFDFELPASGAVSQSEASRASAEPAAAPEAAAAESSGGLDFDFNLDLPPQQEEAPSAPLDLSAISLDLGAPGEAAPPQDAHWQEVATKLDLANAYQEMGDKDGAKELLNEVLNEGDAAQKQQAQTMLTALG